MHPPLLRRNLDSLSRLHRNNSSNDSHQREARIRAEASEEAITAEAARALADTSVEISAAEQAVITREIRETNAEEEEALEDTGADATIVVMSLRSAARSNEEAMLAIPEMADTAAAALVEPNGIVASSLLPVTCATSAKAATVHRALATHAIREAEWAEPEDAVEAAWAAVVAQD